MTRKENGLITGSARTEGNINIYQTLAACQELLLKFGGHEGAAGFSLCAENLEPFMEKIKAVASETPPDVIDGQPLMVDATLSPEQVSIDLYKRIRDLGPFGQGNPPPVFLIDSQLVNNQLMKTGSAHRRLRFMKNGQTVDAVWWNSAQTAVDDQDQFLARLRLNLFRNNANIQLDILEVISCAQADFPQQLPAGQFIDMRGRSVEEIKQIYPQALFFSEGLDHSSASSRRELRANDTLVMLTIPAKVVVWTEILHKVAPRRVVIAWNTQGKAREQVINDAWQQLMGMVKFSLRVYDGIMTPRRVAIHLGWTQDIVKAGLLALADMGLLDITALDEERMTLSIRQNVPLNLRNVQSYRCFVKMLAEAEAYRNYVRNLPVEKLRELLQGRGQTGNHCLTV
jgi:single-stranded-DNA-specific exonuclease